MSAVTVAINLVATDGTSAAFSSFSGSMIGVASRLSGLRGLLHGVSPEFAALGTAAIGAAGLFDVFAHITGDGIQAASDLQQALVRLQFATQDNASEMPVLTSAINDLAIKTKYGSSEAANAFERLTEMGFNTTQILYGMSDSATTLMDNTYHAADAVNGLGNQALYLGQALGGDAVDAAQLLGATMHTFAGDGEDAKQVANELAAAFFNGVPDIDLLTQAIKNGGSAAAILHVPFKDFAITLDLLSQAGLSANQAATSLNYYLNQLASPTIKAAKAMSDLGIITVNTGPAMDKFKDKLIAAGGAGVGAAKQFDGSVTSLQAMFKAGQAVGLIPLDKSFNTWAIQSGLMSSAMFDANGKFIGLKGSAQVLQGALQGVGSDAAKLGFIRDIFNIRGGQDARLLSSMDKFGQKYDELSQRFSKTDLGKLATDQLHTLAGSFDALKDTFTSAIAVAFLPIIPKIADLVTHINDLVGSFQNLDPKVREGIGWFLLIGTIITGVITFVLGLVVAIAGIVAVLSAAGISFGAVAAGLLGLVGAILQAGAIVAFVLAVKDFFMHPPEGIVTFFQNLGGAVLTFWDNIKDFFDAIPGAVGNLDYLGQTFGQLGDVLGQLKPFFEFLLKVLGAIVIVIVGLVFGTLVGAFEALSGLFLGIVQIISGVVQVIIGILKVLQGIFGTIFAVIGDIIHGDWDKIQGDLIDGIQNTVSGIGTILHGLWDIIAGIFNGIVGFLFGLVHGLVFGLIGFFQHLFDVLVGHSIVPDLVKSILNWISNLVTMFLNFINHLVSQVISFFLNLGIRVLIAVNLMVNLVLAAVLHWRDQILHTVSSLVLGFLNFIIQLEVKVLQRIDLMIQLFLAYLHRWLAEGLKLANDFVNGFLGFVTSLPDKAAHAIQTLIDKARNLLNMLKNIGLDAGKGLIDNLINAIKNGLGRLKNIIDDVAKTIHLPLGHSVPEEGPLKDDDQWGGHLIDNLAGSMIDRLPHLAETVSKVAGTIHNPLSTPQVAGTAAASSTSSSGVLVINIPLDGKNIAEYTIDLASKQVRRTGSTRYSR